jgi:hypothetical protein
MKTIFPSKALVALLVFLAAAFVGWKVNQDPGIPEVAEPKITPSTR